MKHYFWLAECVKGRKSGVFTTEANPDVVHKAITEELNENNYHPWVITKLELIEETNPQTSVGGTLFS